MKNKIIILICCVFVNFVYSQNTYYYYDGQKDNVSIDNSKIFILLDATDTNIVKEKISKYPASLEYFKKAVPFENKYWSFIHNHDAKDLIDVLQSVDYYSPSVRTKNNNLVGVSHLFYVKLKSINDTVDLYKIVNEVNVEIVERNEYMPLWFTLSCANLSNSNALQMANYFYETNLFAASEPDFMEKRMQQCANDLLFENQWGLKNVNQNDAIYNYDINYCEASAITNGREDIIVAVFDEGVDLNHPDITNIHHFSFDTENGISPSEMYGSHGTACAGIIGANTNNNIGIAGIASKSPIMSISNKFEATPGAVSTRSRGILVATNNGASVISNSWKMSTYSDLIKDAIETATRRGREGKGCVVVFASGNNNEPCVSFPSSLSSVISVGAISPCGERKNLSSCDGENWGSNYGIQLDVVAPGVLISTTDIHGATGYNVGDYITNFNGTSAACPFVSGVAALILSVNPNLTQKQVRNIIEQTAQKIRSDLYNYGTYEIRPNGSWNLEMGYGLVDAYSAVMMARDMDLYIRDTESDNGEEPSATNGCMWNSPDIWIEDLNGNIVENPIGGKDYNVCVRIHNNKNIASTGEEILHLNWAKAGIDLRWDNNWDGEHFFDCGEYIDKGGVIATNISIPSIEAGGSTTVKTLWSVPKAEWYENCTELNSELWHFCLLARVHDGNEIINENGDNLDMAYFVEHNNNVAWKNLSVLNSDTPSAIVSISNPYREKRLFRIVYKAKQNMALEYVNQFAEVYLHFSENFDKVCKSTNTKGRGTKFIRENIIMLTDTISVIDSLLLYPNELYTMETKVSYLTQLIPNVNEFEFDVVLYDIEKGENVIGGEHYLSRKDETRNFKAVALKDTAVLTSQLVTFSAVNIPEEVEYIWYNANGDTISTQQIVQVQPNKTEYYLLEVVGQYDGAKDYDTVKVTIIDGIINNITPNPASNNISVSYMLSENIPTAMIQIRNNLGIVLNSIIVTNNQTEIGINIASFAKGQYAISLVTINGELIDSDILVIQ